MSYTPTAFVDSPSTSTPITAAELNKIGGGIKSAAMAFLPSSDYADPGYTDQSAALQSWLNAAAAQGRIALLTSGEWRANLTVPHGLSIWGISRGGFEHEVDDTVQSRIGQPTGSTSPVFTFAAGTAHQMLFNLHVDGNQGTSGNLIDIPATGTGQECQVLIECCYLSYPKGAGVFIGANRRAVKVRKTSIINGGGVGVQVNSSDVTIAQCIIGGSAGDGIVITDSVCKVENNEVFGNQHGITVNSGVQGFTIRGNGIDRNREHGVNIAASTVGLIEGNVLHQNAMSFANARSHIALASGITEVAVVGNVFQDDGIPAASATAQYGIYLAGGASDVAKVFARANVGSSNAYRTAKYSNTPTGV